MYWSVCFSATVVSLILAKIVYYVMKCFHYWISFFRSYCFQLCLLCTTMFIFCFNAFNSLLTAKGGLTANWGKKKFYSRLNTSGREPSPCDTPVTHSVDIPTEELKIVRSLERPLPPTLPAPTRKHVDKATNIIYTHANIHTGNEISEKE